MIVSKIYGNIISLRNYLYDRGVFETFDLGARTISIGNITTGGTGKTPLVAYVADVLAARGKRVCILTRGYGRKNIKSRVVVSNAKQIIARPNEAGDEPFDLAQKLVGRAVVIADADRVSAAEWAKRKFGVTSFILDDGFQHRRVRRNVDIVCVDATDPFGGGKLLPTGRLREPPANLTRADIVVITRADLVDGISDLRSQISDLNGEVAIFEAKNEIAKIVSLEEFHAKQQRTQSKEKASEMNSGPFDAAYLGQPALTFCGIGNPVNFFDQLRRENFSVAASVALRDHYIYTQQDIKNIEERARKSGAEILLTTTKDAVKLSDRKFEIPCFVVEIRMTIENAESFEKML